MFAAQYSIGSEESEPLITRVVNIPDVSRETSGTGT